MVSQWLLHQVMQILHSRGVTVQQLLHDPFAGTDVVCADVAENGFFDTHCQRQVVTPCPKMPLQLLVKFLRTDSAGGYDYLFGGSRFFTGCFPFGRFVARWGWGGGCFTPYDPFACNGLDARWGGSIGLICFSAQ